MVASDTVVGIVGAVLLVAVMAGVFVYEYNNVEPVDGNGVDFSEAYPNLDASGDIDGDGIVNSEDSDIDGDGIDNADDDDTAVVVEMQGTIGPGANSLVLEALAETGHTMLHAEATLGNADLGTTSLAIEFDGTQVASDTAGVGSTTISVDADAGEPGTYTAVLRQQPAGPGTSATVTFTVHY